MLVFYQLGLSVVATVNGVILRAYANVGFTPTVYFNELAVFAGGTKPIISITFDDGHSSDTAYAKPVLDAYGYKATCYMAIENLGVAGYMTQANVDFLANYGWDISGHGNTDLSTISLSSAEANVQAVKAYLLQHGYAGSEHYAYPNGGYTDPVKSMVQKYFTTARTIVNTTVAYPYIVPMMVPGRLKHSSDTVASVEGWIDAAVTNNEWLLLCFHSIVPSVTVQATDCLLADFQSIITYIAGKGCAVLPVSRALAALHP